MPKMIEITVLKRQLEKIDKHLLGWLKWLLKMKKALEEIDLKPLISSLLQQ